MNSPFFRLNQTNDFKSEASGAYTEIGEHDESCKNRLDHLKMKKGETTKLPKREISIYVHWPFCKSLCPYCDFNSHVSQSIDHEQWTKAYLKELDFFKTFYAGKSIKSVFFGGGTPSLMSPHSISAILNHLSANSSIDNAEITLEANPTSFEIKKFQEFRNVGINRVSIGVQSLVDRDLKFLGRQHSSNNSISAIKDASKIFDNYSFDLIYARPNQTLEEWEQELKLALSFESKHMSLYQLTIEKGTPFYKSYKNKEFALPSEPESADFFDLTNSLLGGENFKRYEISNYANPGYECLHNMVYWNYESYLGIGPGAHSRILAPCDEMISKISRFKTINSFPISFMMHHSPKKWISEVMNNSHGIQKIESISNKDLIEEILLMGTRISKGISLERFREKTGHEFIDIVDKNFLESIISGGLATISHKSFALTQEGLNLQNFILSRLLV